MPAVVCVPVCLYVCLCVCVFERDGVFMCERVNLEVTLGIVFSNYLITRVFLPTLTTCNWITL